jgi:hypothetical protein
MFRRWSTKGRRHQGMTTVKRRSFEGTLTLQRARPRRGFGPALAKRLARAGIPDRKGAIAESVENPTLSEVSRYIKALQLGDE